MSDTQTGPTGFARPHRALGLAFRGGGRNEALSARTTLTVDRPVDRHLTQLTPELAARKRCTTSVADRAERCGVSAGSTRGFGGLEDPIS